MKHRGAILAIVGLMVAMAALLGVGVVISRAVVDEDAIPPLTTGTEDPVMSISVDGWKVGEIRSLEPACIGDALRSGFAQRTFLQATTSPPNDSFEKDVRSKVEAEGWRVASSLRPAFPIAGDERFGLHKSEDDVSKDLFLIKLSEREFVLSLEFTTSALVC